MQLKNGLKEIMQKYVNIRIDLNINIIKILFSISIIFISSINEVIASSTSTPVEFEVISDDKKTYVSANLSYDKYEKPIRLEDFNDQADIGLMALKRYYDALKLGDINKIKSQFFKSDGSYSNIVELTENNPSIFAKYQQLDKVDVLSKVLWGEYHIYYVRLYAKDRITDWREELICQKSFCYITRTLDNSDDYEELFEAAYYFLIKRYKPIVLSKKQQSEKLKHSDLSVFPRNEFAYGKGLNPLSFGIYPDIYSKNLYDFDTGKWSSKKSESHPELDFLVSMLTEIRSYKVEGNDFSRLMPLIKKYWLNVDESSFIIQLNRLEDNKEKPEISMANYVLNSFYQTIQNWKNIRPIGSIVSDKTTYIIANIEGSNSTSTMQVFSVQQENGHYKMSILNNDVTSAVVINDVFIKILFKWAQDWDK